jgi:hypothetical protein
VWLERPPSDGASTAAAALLGLSPALPSPQLGAGASGAGAGTLHRRGASPFKNPAAGPVARHLPHFRRLAETSERLAAERAAFEARRLRAEGWASRGGRERSRSRSPRAGGGAPSQSPPRGPPPPPLPPPPPAPEAQLAAMHPQAVLLPTGWSARVSASSGVPYFVETATGLVALDPGSVAEASGLPPAALLPDPRAPPLPAGWTTHVSRTTGLAYCVAPGGGAVGVLSPDTAAWSLPRTEGDAALPSGARWAQKFSATKGRPYFVNLDDGAVRWALPPDAQLVFAGAPPPSARGGAAPGQREQWGQQLLQQEEQREWQRPHPSPPPPRQRRPPPPSVSADSASSRGWASASSDSSSSRSFASEDFYGGPRASEWMRKVSRASGKAYFVNVDTRERAWSVPQGGVEVRVYQ